MRIACAPPAAGAEHLATGGARCNTEYNGRARRVLLATPLCVHSALRASTRVLRTERRILRAIKLCTASFARMRHCVL